MTKDLVGPWVRRFLIEYVMVERNYSSNTVARLTLPCGLWMINSW